MDVTKRALLVGIDHYRPLTALTGCVADAKALHKVLRSHENGEPNYDCQLLTSGDDKPVNRELLSARVEELFQQPADHVLFHFSGHGMSTRRGTFLVAQNGRRGDPGLPMDQLLLLANESKAKTVLLILDCCYAGRLGDPSLIQGNDHLQKALLRKE